MRIQFRPNNFNYYIGQNNIRTNQNNKTTQNPIPTNYASYSFKTNMIQFTGLFTPSIEDRIQYGLQALDEESLLIVTDEKSKEDSEAYLKHSINSITQPISKIYSVIVKEDELGKRNSSLDNHFAIFKNKDGYHVLPLGYSIYIDGGKLSGYDKNNSIKKGETKLLKAGDRIKLLNGLLLDNDIYYNFQSPKKYSTEEAKKYLEYRAINTSKEEIVRFNKSSINKILDNNTDKTDDGKITFDDIGGLDSQISQLKASVLRPLKYPEVYKPIRLNKGILLSGPPRCGKTMLGMALANEAGVDYIYMNANEFKSGIVGSSEAQVRNAFDKLMGKPQILFIDEFDSIAKTRAGSNNARYDDSVVNQFLGCMSDLEKSKTNSFVIAATNRIDLIDEAMKSTGRFGLHISVPLPDEESLGLIYDIYAKKIPLEGSKEEQDELKSNCCKTMKRNNFNGSDVAETFSIAYLNSLERLGMNEKMDKDEFMPSDLNKIYVSADDIIKAIEQICLMKKEIKDIDL